MSMTKKHFEAIAKVVKDQRTLTPAQKQNLALALASEFVYFNHNFDVAKFVSACYEHAK